MNFKFSETLTLPLKVSVWVVDEDRYSTLLATKNNSVVWLHTCMVWICYLNACRSLKMEPEIEIADMEFRVEELLSGKEGKKYLLDIETKITEEIQALSATDDSGPGEEKKSKVKKQTGNK